MSQAAIDAVCGYLEEKGVPYELFRHEPVFTCEESHEKVNIENCCACKNLFVKDVKSGLFYLIVLRWDKHADLKQLCGFVGARRFAFASEEELDKKLGVYYGFVSPFGLLNDASGKTRFMVDEDVLSAERVKFHPNDNTASIVMTHDAFMAYVDSLGKNIIKVRTDVF